MPKGEIVALIGANGAGKTTTLKVLSGLLKSERGSISLGGERIDGCSPEEIVRRGLVHVPEARGLFPDMTVLDNLLMGAYAAPVAGRRDRDLATAGELSLGWAEKRLAKVSSVPSLKVLSQGSSPAWSQPSTWP